MTEAKQRGYYKDPSDVKSFVVNCRGDMRQGETVASVGAAITQTYADGTEVAADDQVSIQGAAPNAGEICEPGFEAIPIGRGIEGFFVGGASSAKIYRIRIPYTTSLGQELGAEVLLRVR